MQGAARNNARPGLKKLPGGPKKGIAQVKTDQITPENASFVAAAIERHKGPLVRYATRLLAHDVARAQEIVEATFTELKTLPVEDVEEEIAEWLFAGCRRRAFDILHREGRMKKFEASDEDRNTAGPFAGDAADTEEPHVTMQRLIDRLTPKQQEAMRLKFQDGFGHKEIAYITDLSPSNVGILVHNAVVRLARDFHAQRAAPGSKGSNLASRDDPRLTLYALGEMEDRERKSFEGSLLDKKAAGAKVDEIRATCTVIGKTLAIEAGAPAPRAIRRKKRKRRSGVALWFSFPRILVILAGGAVIAGLAVFFIRRNPDESTPVAATPPVDFRLKAAPWEEKPEAAEEEGGSAVGSGAGPTDRSERSGNVPVLPPHASPARAGGHPALAKVSGLAGLTGEISREAPADLDGAGTTGPVPLGVSATARGKRGDVRPENDESKTVAAPTGEVAAIAGPSGERPPESPGPSSPPKDLPPPAARERQKSRPLPATPGGAKPGQTTRKFDSPKESPVSQLSADTDTASVIDLKRSLASGRWPAAGSVRVEEMLNYFPYHYAPPEAPADFAPAMESSEAPWAPAHRLVRVGLKAREAPPPARAAASLILLVDTSGSMAPPNRLPLVKEAARLLLGRLRPDDRVGVVTYAGESRLTLMPTLVAESRKILDAIGRLEARGMTNGGAGLELAYDLAQAHAVRDGVNCVILCTDGDFNVGAVSEAELTQLIGRRAKTAVQLSIFGFGRNGRIDPRLEALAAHGRGGSGYVNTRREAEQVLTAQLNGLFEPVAKDAKVEVAFNPATVKNYHLIGYEDRGGELQDGGSPVDSGPVLPGHSLTALYEVETADGIPAGAELLRLRVKYSAPRDGAPRQLEFPFRDRPASFEAASLDFKFAAAVAAFGMALHDSPEKRGFTLDQVAAWGRECLGDDVGGYRSEFLSLVELAKAARP